MAEQGRHTCKDMCSLKVKVVTLSHCQQGTEKTEETLNIFLEYVPGGSIASLLAKFGKLLFCMLFL